MPYSNLDYFEKSLIVHEQLRGKIGIHTKLPLDTPADLSIAYTPGVARPCEAIAANPDLAGTLTLKNNTIGIVSDGSAVLGLGNIGPLAAIPVMEGKAMLFKQFARINAFPICVDTQDADEIIETVRRIAPVFGGINLEDIAAPKCFAIEEALQDLGIPVFHDDQHGTAIVLLAGLINAAKVTQRRLSSLKVVINGAGAAGISIAKLLRCIGHDLDRCVPVEDIVVCDSRGAIHAGRDDLNDQKKELLPYTNRSNKAGTLSEILPDTDVFIGVSQGNVLTQDDIKRMASDPIIFAMANPIPEIMPDLAHEAGASIVGTGRSDFPNQINNVLAFPGIFRGALDAGAPRITEAMKLAAAHALAKACNEPVAERILPDALDRCVAPQIATAVKEAWEESKV